MAEKKKKPGEISYTREVDHTIVTAIERPEGESKKRAYILFLTGPLVGKLLMLENGESVIGRGKECTILVNDNRVSRQHVSIAVKGDKAVLRDMGSTNGTFVNGRRVEEKTLKSGDKIQISSATIFKYALQDRTENVFHKELYKMAVMDTVTNIYNKRYFLERLKEEFSHAKRGKKPLTLVMIDIDFFKKVNDTYGHLAGDMVLHQVAARLQGMIRTEDLLARYGGEEFAVLLRGANEEKALALAERMRRRLDEEPIKFEGQDIAVTISLGLATLTPESDIADGKALIAASDECLYASKQNGRNRVTTLSQKKNG